MKKSVLSLVTVMVLGTMVCFGINSNKTDDNKDKEDTTEQAMCPGHHRHGFGKDDKDMKPGRGPRHPGPRIEATEGCTCNTCEQIRKMEEMRKKFEQEHKDCHPSDSLCGK